MPQCRIGFHSDGGRHMGYLGQHAMATIAFVSKKLAMVSGKDPKEVMPQMKSDLNNCLAVAKTLMQA